MREPNPWRFGTVRADGVVVCVRCGRVLRTGQRFVQGTGGIVCLRPGAQIQAAPERRDAQPRVFPRRGREN